VSGAGGAGQRREATPPRPGPCLPAGAWTARRCPGRQYRRRGEPTAAARRSHNGSTRCAYCQREPPLSYLTDLAPRRDPSAARWSMSLTRCRHAAARAGRCRGAPSKGLPPRRTSGFAAPRPGLLVSGLDALPSGYNSRPGSAALLRKVGAAEVPERSQHILPANSERLPVVPIHGCHVRRSSGSGRALEAMSRDSRRARGKRAT
jgi:hypothetical protein